MVAKGVSVTKKDAHVGMESVKQLPKHVKRCTLWLEMPATPRSRNKSRRPTRVIFCTCCISLAQSIRAKLVREEGGTEGHGTGTTEYLPTLRTGLGWLVSYMTHKLDIVKEIFLGLETILLRIQTGLPRGGDDRPQNS